MKYKDAGVDINKAAAAFNNIKMMLKSTFSKNVIEDLGNFGSLYKISDNRYLAASTDGVGTKLKIAFKTGIHNTIGEDLVNHCTNDILALGAYPIFFLDYIGTGKLEENIYLEIIKGLTKGCRKNNCALIGGETAEMPGLYHEGEYDLAGFIVGEVQRQNIVGKELVKKGDVLIALKSSGLHTNGYSLARKVFSDKKIKLSNFFDDLGETLGENLLKIHKSYLKLLEKSLSEHMINAIAHITGGGITGNLKRVIPDKLHAKIEKKWDIPPIFKLIRELGDISEKEMYGVFNMGVGIICIVSENNCNSFKEDLKYFGEDCIEIGYIDDGDKEGKVIL